MSFLMPAVYSTNTNNKKQHKYKSVAMLGEINQVMSQENFNQDRRNLPNQSCL